MAVVYHDPKLEFPRGFCSRCQVNAGNISQADRDTAESNRVAQSADRNLRSLECYGLTKGCRGRVFRPSARQSLVREGPLGRLLL